MNSAIDACARARPTRLKEAFDILEHQTTKNADSNKDSSSNSNNNNGIRPNVFTFGALMSACARARKGDRARNLLKTMQVRTKLIHHCRSAVAVTIAIAIAVEP
jgi:pentatricopeptide repeat protein